ncbi:hypothetical protein FACS189440_05650 [Bacteroidia bacterium]|nr:hypothetical protein FACS189423_01560 [Bacteroidia bacterium]GHT46808.1 hypothetical protein FACS189440_05650 [Bacteroidia bacterium]
MIQSMNTLELEVKRKKIAKEPARYPCRMSVEELRYEVMLSVKDAKMGLGKSIEEIRAKYA